jgi:hypothetical protein
VPHPTYTQYASFGGEFDAVRAFLFVSTPRGASAWSYSSLLINLRAGEDAPAPTQPNCKTFLFSTLRLCTSCFFAGQKYFLHISLRSDRLEQPRVLHDPLNYQPSFRETAAGSRGTVLALPLPQTSREPKPEPFPASFCLALLPRSSQVLPFSSLQYDPAL